MDTVQYDLMWFWCGLTHSPMWSLMWSGWITLIAPLDMQHCWLEHHVWMSWTTLAWQLTNHIKDFLLWWAPRGWFVKLRFWYPFNKIRQLDSVGVLFVIGLLDVIRLLDYRIVRCYRIISIIKCSKNLILGFSGLAPQGPFWRTGPATSSSLVTSFSRGSFCSNTVREQRQWGVGLVY